jgi:hypothetical protein
MRRHGSMARLVANAITGSRSKLSIIRAQATVERCTCVNQQNSDVCLFGHGCEEGLDSNLAQPKEKVALLLVLVVQASAQLY